MKYDVIVTRGRSKMNIPEIIFTGYTYVNDFSDLLDTLRRNPVSTFILSENTIPTLSSDKILSFLDETIPSYDILWLNKIKDECEYHHKISEELRKSKRPGSVQAVYLSEDVVNLVLEQDLQTEQDLVLFLNSLTSSKRTAVTANNYFTTSMNSVTCLEDFEKFIECDYPYKKNKMYNTGYKITVFLIFFGIVLIMAAYLLLAFR